MGKTYESLLERQDKVSGYVHSMKLSHRRHDYRTLVCVHSSARLTNL